MAQALYRRWRSQTFEDVVGQEHVALTLRNAVRDGHLSHAYLFTGPRGTGKTSTARILAKAINCLAEDPAARPCNECRICVAITEGRLLDLIEIDAASNRGIDEIRDLREKIGFRPGEARYKVYIIDEVHMLTKEAFNALLKTLEEPPPHAIFVLATTEPDRVPETVRSRCQRFDFRRIPTTRIVQHLQEILDQEGGRAAPEALAAIARRSTGSMRDAISLLDQLLSYGDDVISLDRVSGVLGLVDGQMIGRLVDNMVANEAGPGLTLINDMVAEGVDLGQLVDQILAYLRAVLFVQVTHAPDALDLSQEVADTVARQAAAVPAGVILNALREFLEARSGLREQVPGVPQLPIELAFLRAALSGSNLQAAPARGAVMSELAAPAAGERPAAIAQPAGSVPATRPPTGENVATPAPRQDAPPTLVGSPAAATAAQSQPGTRTETPRGAAPAGDLNLVNAANQNWERFLVLVGKRCGVQVKAALRAVKTLEVAGTDLVLLWPPAHKFSLNLVNKGENRQQIEAVWEEVLGRRIQIRCGLAGEGVQAAEPKATNDEDDFLRQARNLGAQVTRLD
jgi:DNA polymerase III subunit gamma/tau